MKSFQVTVNGNIYQVEVEELQGGSVAQAPATSAPAAPVAAPKAPAAQTAPAPAAAPAGATKVEAPMQGKIVGVKVNVGDSVKQGEVVVILEAMKMENEIVSPAAGKVASVHVTVGQQVNAGDLMISMN